MRARAMASWVLSDGACNNATSLHERAVKRQNLDGVVSGRVDEILSRGSTSVYSEVPCTRPVTAPVRVCTRDDLVLGNWTLVYLIASLSLSRPDEAKDWPNRSVSKKESCAGCLFRLHPISSPSSTHALREGAIRCAFKFCRDRAPGRVLIGCNKVGLEVAGT